MSYFYILYGCTLVGTVLSLKCNNHCPYGFVPDVEGELTCNCYDPCAMIMCQPGYECEAVMPSNCEREQCRAVTSCKVSAMKLEKEYDFIASWRDLPIPQQKDDPFTGGNRGSDVSTIVCSTPVTPEAFQCKHTQRRWFYNITTGRCERFYGCTTEGNNFARKRSCKDKCKGQMIPLSELKAISPDDSACARSPSYKDFLSCDTKRRRWFYNEKTGRCEKFTGCEGNGNNFARKVLCKAKCRNVITKFRRSRNTGSRSKSPKPR